MIPRGQTVWRMLTVLDDANVSHVTESEFLLASLNSFLLVIILYNQHHQ
jgi:hypothetical protein